jgi:hypothetical protein
MWKPYKSYEEIPEKEQQDICKQNDVNNITDVPLEDINSFYNGIELYDAVTSIKRWHNSYYKDTKK